MSNSGRQPHYDTGPRRPKKAVERTLDDSGISTDRFIDLYPGTKTPAQKWRGDGFGRPADAVGEDYGIKCGDGLIVIDIDHPEKLPADLPPTYKVISPHGDAERAHFYYRVEEPVESTREDYGSNQSDGSMVVGPGSTLDHEGYCDDGKEDCPGEGTGTYEAIERPIATLDLQTLDAITTGRSEKTRPKERFQLVDDPDDDLIERAKDNLRYFQATRSGLAFDDLNDLLCGGTGSIDGLRHDDDTIDRDKADLEALWMLYGVMLHANESEDDAAELAYAIFTHYCNEVRYMKDGEKKRKWLTRPEAYRRNRLNAAIDDFDVGSWRRWSWREYEGGFDPNDPEHYSPGRDYSNLKQSIARAIIDAYSGLFDVETAEEIYGIDLSELPPPHCHNMGPGGDHPPIAGPSGDCPFPSPKQVREAMVEVDQICTERTAKNVLRELRKDGQLKWAELVEGVDYRIYPASFSDPAEANRVKTGGEEYVPEDDPDSIEEESDQTVMTDGGTRTDDAEDDVDKPSHTTEDLGGLDRRSPAVFACPIEGCSRIVIDNPGDLRNHVAQESDGAHRHRTLDENLEVVVHWDEMDWSPGAPE